MMQDNSVKSDNKKQWVFINAVKFLAILLVLNSHFDIVYPISALATGGAIGNGLFFIILGYCSYNVPDGFPKWYAKKLSRLFVPVFIVSVIMTIISGIADISFGNVIKTFIWPTRFWFFGALVIFYVVYYLAIKKGWLDKFLVTSIIFAIVYAVYYIFLLDKSGFVVEAGGLGTIESNFKMIYYSYIMLLGAYLRHKDILKRSFNRLGLFFMAGGSFVLMYAIKLLAAKINVLYQIQFMEQMCVIVFAVSAFLFASTFEDMLSKHSKLCNVIKVLSNYSFEVYVLQFMFIDLFCEMAFPINMVLILICIAVASYVLKIVSQVILKVVK